MGKEKMVVTLDREFIGEPDRLGTTYCSPPRFPRIPRDG